MDPETEIYKSLRRSRMIVWGLVVAFICSMLFMSLLVFRIYAYQMNHVLTLDKNGQVLPLTWIERDEDLRIEMKHHVEMFLKDFYEYDRDNWKRRIEKALWLSDKSVEQIVLKRENEGWFNQVTQLAVTEKIIVNPDSIHISGVKEPFSFDVPAILIIENGPEKKMYSFRTRGQLITVHRNYPYNPHGLLITDFQERQKREIKE